MMFLHVALWEGDAWSVDRLQASHIKARRLRDGDDVCLVDGDGKWQRGVLARNQTIIVLQESGLSPKSSVKKCLAFGWSKPQTMELIVEKAVELGITDVMPLLSDYVAYYPTQEQIEKRMLRFQSISYSALCQCEGYYLPTLHQPITVKQWLQNKDDCAWFLLDPTGSKFRALPEGNVGMLVGPEGGWSQSEREMMLSKVEGSWSLWGRILRVETAAVAAMTLMNL